MISAFASIPVDNSDNVVWLASGGTVAAEHFLFRPVPGLPFLWYAAVHDLTDEEKDNTAQIQSKLHDTNTGNVVVAERNKTTD